MRETLTVGSEINLARAIVEAHHVGRKFAPRRRLLQRRGLEQVVALDGVSFTLQTGRCLALEGPNGAGKSTLLKILATIIAPTSGRATVAGHDVAVESAAVRRVVGYAGNADRSFFWPLTGRENLVFFGQLAGMSAADADAAADRQLDLVGLAAAGSNRVSGYSAGMRQRLGLARALLHAPALLLLDEPTANLDAEYRDVAIEILNGVVGEGRSVIVATHDPGLVAETATDRLRLEDGRVVTPRAASDTVRYAVDLAPDDGSEESQRLFVDDLGDGHVLAERLSQAIAEGRDIVSVEKL